MVCVILQVEHGEAVRVTETLARVDEVLARDGQMEQQLHSKLEEWLGGVPASRAQRVARMKVKCSSPPRILAGSGIDGGMEGAL